MIALAPILARSSAMRWPSVQWSNVMLRPNSRAILIDVKMSSAL